MPVNTTIKIRKGTESDWQSSNPVLASGEPGYAIDTNRFKIGNGISNWNSLDYAAVIPSGFLAGSGINVGLGTNGESATISVSGLNSSYISDFNEAVDDRIGSGLFAAGTGINLTYNDGGNTFTVSVTGLINNPTNNRILTSRDSTTTGIDAENNLTFDGSLLAISGNLVANTGTINSLNFNDIGDPDLSIRQLAWNNSEGSLAVGLSDTYEMFLGGELHYRVRNNTGSSILAGTAVYATGLTPGGNNRIEIAPKAADGSIREVRFMGLVTENIDNGVNGFTTHFGYIRNIDTRGDYAANGATNKVWASGEPVWAEGDLLYVHPTVAGKLTKIEPKHSISVAIILNRHQNQGKLFVRPTSYGHLNDNHDVAVSGATNGQFLQYNSVTDYWVPSSSGNFTTLLVNGTGVSVSGHAHTASQITDFNEAVDDRIGSGLFVAGTGINLNYNDSGNSFTVSVTGVSFSGHNHTGDDILIEEDDFNNTTLSKASVAAKFLTQLNSNGLVEAIDSTQNQIQIYQIEDFNSSVSGLLPTISNSGDNRILTSTGSVNGINAESNLTFDNLSNTLNIGATGQSNAATLNLYTNDSGDGSPSINFKDGSASNKLRIYWNDDENMSYVHSIEDSLILQGPNNNYFSANNDGSLGIVSSGITVVTVNNNLSINNQTANTIASFDANKNVVSLSTGTYPSLTELSYVKGVTSAIQTQLNAKQNTLTNAVTGTGVASHIAYWNSSSGIIADSGQLYWDSTNNRLGIGTETPASQLQVVGTGRFTNIDINNSAIAGSSALTVNGSISTQNQGVIAGQFSIYGDQNTRLYKPDSTTFAMSSANSGIKQSFGYLVGSAYTPSMTITNSGVGIGTTSPAYNFHVIGTGNFSQNLLVNGVPVSVSGHSHTVSDITNFNTSVSGLLPTISNSGDNRILTSTGTSIGVNAESNATFDGTTLAVSGAISVDNLKLDGNTLSSINSNGSIIIQPSGTGALQRDSGGDARGQYAVDWQTVRTSGTMVAAANYSVIGGGENNTVISTSNHSIVGGGRYNNISGTSSSYSTIGGGYRNAMIATFNTGNTISGGRGNVVEGTNSHYVTIGGGRNNNISGTNSYYSTIGGGDSNSVSGANSYWSTIGGGKSNTVSGTTSYYSTIGGGRSNVVSGDSSSYSVIGGGRYNTVSGNYSYWSTIGGGNSNVVSGTTSGYSTIGGGRSNVVSGTASEYSTIGGGKSNVVSGDNSSCSTIGGGDSNSVSGNYSYYSTIGGGRYNSVSGTSSQYSTIGGGKDNAVSGISSQYSTIGGGRYNTVSGDNSYYSTIGGGYLNTVSGTYSDYSTIGGGYSNSVSGYASHHSTIGGGYLNTVSGTGSQYSTIGGGYSNTVSGTGSQYSTIGGGKSNSVSGYISYYSTIGGGRDNTVSGTGSQYSTIPGGFRAATTRYGELSHAAGYFANNGDAQHTVLIARKLTTNNTANQVLFLDASSARLTLPAETTWTFEIKLSAYNDTDNAAAGWIYRGVIRRNAANSTVLVGSLIEESWKETAMNSTSASVVADDTNEALEIRVTGLTSKNIRWVAVVDISQVSYGTP